MSEGLGLSGLSGEGSVVSGVSKGVVGAEGVEASSDVGSGEGGSSKKSFLLMDDCDVEAETLRAREALVESGYDFSVPEGFEVDERTASEAAAMFGELGLDSEQGRRLTDYWTSNQKGWVSSEMDLVGELRSEFGERLREDSQVGGRDVQRRLAVARRGFRKYASPELAEFLSVSGLVDHPVMVRFFYGLGKGLMEDSFVQGAPAVGERSMNLGDMAERIFDVSLSQIRRR